MERSKGYAGVNSFQASKWQWCQEAAWVDLVFFSNLDSGQMLELTLFPQKNISCTFISHKMCFLRRKVGGSGSCILVQIQPVEVILIIPSILRKNQTGSCSERMAKSLSQKMMNEPMNCRTKSVWQRHGMIRQLGQLDFPTPLYSTTTAPVLHLNKLDSWVLTVWRV